MQRLLIILILFASCHIFGQSVNTDSLFEPKLRGTPYEFPLGYTGTPFYTDEWLKGDIMTPDGRQISNKLLRYDGYSDLLVWFREEDSLWVQLDPDFIQSFTLYRSNGSVARFKKSPVVLNTAGSFVEFLAGDEYQVFVRRKVAVRGSENRKIEGKVYAFGVWQPQYEYYLLLPDNSSLRFRKINKRSVLEPLPDQYYLVFDDIIRKGHLRLRNEIDLIRLITSINASVK